jgi:hypothetical protein
MYLSQPPVTTVMLMIAYQHPAPPGSRNMLKVMILEKHGVTLGLVYETLAANMPADDKSLKTAEKSGPISAYVCWYETVEDGGEDKDGKDQGGEDNGGESKGNGDDSSKDEGSGDDGDNGEGSVIYDSEGNVMGDSGSETYEYTEHESELGSDTGPRRQRNRVPLQVLEFLGVLTPHRPEDFVDDATELHCNCSLLRGDALSPMQQSSMFESLVILTHPMAVGGRRLADSVASHLQQLMTVPGTLKAKPPNLYDKLPLVVARTMMYSCRHC